MSKAFLLIVNLSIDMAEIYQGRPQQLRVQHSQSAMNLLQQNRQVGRGRVSMHQWNLDAKACNQCQDISSPFEEPQFVVILNNQHYFCFRKQDIQAVQFFKAEFIDNDRRVFIANQPLNVKAFSKVKKFLEGFQCSFQKSWEVYEIFEVADFLKLQDLKNKLSADLKINFNEYGFFLIFEIAEKFDISELKLKCLQQLIEEDFEQLNFNRYDLIQCSREVFVKLMKLQKVFQQEKIIKGLRKSNVAELISEYAKYNPSTILSQQDFLIDELFRNLTKGQYDELKRVSTQQLNQDISCRLSSYELSESITFGSPIRIVEGHIEFKILFDQPLEKQSQNFLRFIESQDELIFDQVAMNQSCRSQVSTPNVDLGSFNKFKGKFQSLERLGYESTCSSPKSPNWAAQIEFPTETEHRKNCLLLSGRCQFSQEQLAQDSFLQLSA